MRPQAIDGCEGRFALAPARIALITLARIALITLARIVLTTGVARLTSPLMCAPKIEGLTLNGGGPAGTAVLI